MNTNESEHDMVGAYVLDALSDEERGVFEAHLQSCSACRLEVVELQQVVDVMSLASERVDPAPQLKDRILKAIADESDERPALVPLAGGRPTPRKRVPWRLPEVITAAVAAVLIVGLGLWNVHLQRQINNYQASLAYQRQLEAAIAGHASVSVLPGTGEAKGASAALVQPRHKQPAYLVVQGLPGTPPGKVYELWLIRGTSTPQPAGVFSYGGNGPQRLALKRPVSGYSVAAVTIERGPHGTTVPAGPKILAGSLQS